MESSKDEGPDGSSIKPVSSLLARFETLKTPSSPVSSASSRPISPAPKPDKLRSFKPALVVDSTSTTSPSPPELAPKPALKVPQQRNVADLHQARRDAVKSPALPHPSTRPPQTASKALDDATAMPPPPTPSVKVLPPQSPPKAQASTTASGQRSPFLDPVFASTHDGPGGPPTPMKIPSRPMTPINSLSSPRSPRLTSSQPPSPPPPRRSAEFRDRQKQPPPPPAPRRGSRNPSPSAATLPDSVISQSVPKERSTIQTSPFGSLPVSQHNSDKEEDDAPPQLPARPKASAEVEANTGEKPAIGGFEVPPVHFAVAGKRIARDNAANGTARAHVTPQRTGEPRLIHQIEMGNVDNLQRAGDSHSTVPPPKPPRPVLQKTPSNASALSASAPPSGTPKQLTTHQYPAPPTRNQGASRALASERPSDRDFNDSRARQPSAGLSTAADVPAASSEIKNLTMVYPNGANVNRRPPYVKKGCFEIQSRYEPRTFDICGELVCTSGHLTRVWNTLDGEQIMSLSHTEGIKATAVAFKPATDPDLEGSFIWIGTNAGELMEVETATQRITQCRDGIHGKIEVIRIHRHHNELWTLDEGGTLHLWAPGEDGTPSISGNPAQSFKVPKAHTFSMVVGDELWHATGKAIRVFQPTVDGNKPFQVLVRPLAADGCGDVNAGTLIPSNPGKIALGHVDGKISLFSTKDYTCQMVINTSSWKINGLASCGQYIWAAHNTGKICVYDTSSDPWTLKKEWQAHEHSALRMKSDWAAPYRLDRLQVASLGADGKVKFWDGHLQDNWLEDNLKSKDVNYCKFEEIKALVMTWNAGASTPHSLRYSEGDAAFFQNLLQSSGSPDILVFGFQELVDLEDKAATAKRFLKAKKKEGTAQERMSHQYRDWRDFLLKCLDDYMPADDLYHLLQSSPLVGLFTCVFVKSSLRDRISGLSAAEVKRGMGGLHGNKGAVAIRFRVDDTSLCFINCHLAAGQSHANSRHGDIAAILEANLFPTERDPEARLDTFTGGGDGSMVLDHELCILNGDLNYRIDTMSRDTVVKAVKQQQLAKLLERDQLLVARRRNAAFRLRAFEELPITFDPTYKYDVGTDNYDTSEKRRSPAWCDRLLFRGQGRIRQLEYMRHEVRVSDHRPVTGRFKLWVKKVEPRGRARAWLESQEGYENMRSDVLENGKISYLMDTCGYDQKTSNALIQQRASRRAK